MPNSLRANLDTFAAEFTAAIIEAVRSSSLAEILDIPPAPALRRSPGRPRGSYTKPAPATAAGPYASTAPSEPAAHRERGRSTDADAELIVKYLRSHPGTRGELARRSLGLVKGRWNACVYRGIRDGKIRKQSEPRSTRYWAVG